MNLCPFEKTKTWKYGVSVKCPNMTEVLWTRDDLEQALNRVIAIKRKVTCRGCKHDILTFLEAEVGNIG